MYSQLSRILRQSSGTLWAVSFDALELRLFYCKFMFFSYGTALVTINPANDFRL
jgi:hypothetical protein